MTERVRNDLVVTSEGAFENIFLLKRATETFKDSYGEPGIEPSSFTAIGFRYLDDPNGVMDSVAPASWSVWVWRLEDAFSLTRTEYNKGAVPDVQAYNIVAQIRVIAREMTDQIEAHYQEMVALRTPHNIPRYAQLVNFDSWFQRNSSAPTA